MVAGKVIACIAGAALVACLGTAGVAGASGVWGGGGPACDGVGSACAHVDENGDGVCDNCRVTDGTCETCGRSGCDGTHAHLRAHDGTGTGCHAHGRGRCGR